MRDTIIENPVINSPYKEPDRHFKFGDEGIENEIIEKRRVSSYFIPIAKPKKKKKDDQPELFETGWTKDRIEENKFINDIREKVSIWRKAGYPASSITKTTKKLLDHWTSPEREKRFFFCQLEAVETLIYLTEIAKRDGEDWIENNLRSFNQDANPELFRIDMKMATGSGKTLVMALLIAWHALNKIANPQDKRFSDTFLIVTPGITIRDRLRVLLPNDPENYYWKWDIIPSEDRQELHKAKILITNFHAFKLREKVKAGKLTKSLLAEGEKGVFTETPAQMVRRVCKEFGNKKSIVVINDEAHHCYRRRVGGEEVRLKGDERKEAEKREEEARIWISGLEAVRKKIGLKVVYDLSATPFFLRGSGYSEGTLFPWVVSDFSLIDAIESGIVKVPRVPVSDDSMTGDQPTYRDLWYRIRDHLPKKGRKTGAVSGEPKLPKELQGALHSLYGNYQKYYQRWQENTEAQAKGLTPPVFIVVCNNTNVSKLVYDWIAGWEKQVSEDKAVLVPGQLPIFNNVENGNWTARPNTILIDSQQLESGDAMSSDFKAIASLEIQRFKDEYKQRFPDRDVEKLTDEDLLREVMNTVGKSGKLGEQIKCVISVSMLTEGWDANTVTHILGVRAFGTQLLCEQVVGRGLRRMSYALDGQECFSPEYAEIYGVPFSFIPCSGSTIEPKPGPIPTRVRALEDRTDLEIRFPRLMGYRYEIRDAKLGCKFTKDSQLALSTQEIPTKVENRPIVGQMSIHTLDELKRRRPQEVAFLLAKLTLEKYFRQDGEIKEGKSETHRFDADVKYWLFPQVLKITQNWLTECLTLKSNTFPQLLLLVELAHDASDRIYHSIVDADQGRKLLKPILVPYDVEGSSRFVDFDTTRPVYATNPAKCHVNYVVADTDSWEQKVAQSIEDMDEVVAYIKNHALGFKIPYTIGGEEKNYVPDYLVRIKNKQGETINLIIEVTGEQKKDKAAKVATAKLLWVPAVNNHGGFGKWEFIEINDPWDTENLIRDLVRR